MKNVPKLLDMLRSSLGLKSDVALARHLGVDPSLISRLRSGMVLGDKTILRIHEKTGIPVGQIRSVAT